MHVLYELDASQTFTHKKNLFVYLYSRTLQGPRVDEQPEGGGEEEDGGAAGGLQVILELQ